MLDARIAGIESVHSSRQTSHNTIRSNRLVDSLRDLAVVGVRIY